MNKTICSKHETIITLCGDILEIDFNKAFKAKLKRKLKKIVDVAEDARISGQKMEDRLTDYHEAIIELGFKRNK